MRLRKLCLSVMSPDDSAFIQHREKVEAELSLANDKDYSTSLADDEG